MASLELRGVVKRYREATVIHGVDLAFERGEFIVFVGPSGCGKSTLLRIICGLESASEGDILIDAARMDHASEWRIYWRIILPLTAPALAVLAIFSVMWRWNEFLWPMVVLNKSETFTLQLALNSFQGELTTSWNYLLAMTVLTLLPVTVIFALLQRHITQGIASSGVK